MLKECLTGMEALLSAALEIGLFWKIYGSKQKYGIWEKVLLILTAPALLGLEMYQQELFLTPVLLTVFLAAFTGGWLWRLTDVSFWRCVCWSFFWKGTMMILRTIILVVCGIERGGNIRQINYQKPLWGSMAVMGILLCLIVVSLKWESGVIPFLKILIDKSAWMLLALGAVEVATSRYLRELSWYQIYRTYALALALIIQLCLLLAAGLLLLVMQRRAAEKERRMLLSKEKLLESNYELIRQEYEKNRRINHDHKYDLTYLYECFSRQDREAGMAYIGQKMDAYRQRQKSEVWTGCGCVDFLLNNVKACAQEKDIDFRLDIDVVGIPIAEYDFFAVLGNLLDNALEAAQQCARDRRYIELKLFTINEMINLCLVNGYETEPRMKNGRFLSSKETEEGHGWGIENVKEIVERHDGFLKIEHRDHMFLVELLIGDKDG